jgi:hypothetical protein
MELGPMGSLGVEAQAVRPATAAMAAAARIFFTLVLLGFFLMGGVFGSAEREEPDEPERDGGVSSKSALFRCKSALNAE